MAFSNFLIGGGLAIGIVCVGVILFSWAFARLWCMPQRNPHFPIDAFDLSLENVTFFSNGVRLSGWFISSRHNGISAPAVIVPHGWSSNASRMLSLARLLHRADFSVLLYDARGHGISNGGGPMTILKFAEDIIAAIEYLKTRNDVDSNRLAIVGHSMGGASSILAASMETGIQAVVSSSAFADPVALTKEHLKRLHFPKWPFFGIIRHFIEKWMGTTMKDVSPKNRIDRLTAPLLLIHGDSDHFIPSSNMETLFENANRDITERLILTGCGHSDVLKDLRFEERTIQFLKKNTATEIEKPQVEWEETEYMRLAS